MQLRREAEELYERWQYQDAKRRSLQLLEVAKDSQDTYTQALALLIAGNSQRELGEYRASVQSFEQMLTLPQGPQHEKIVRGTAYNGTGAAYIHLGEHAKAIENFTKYLEIAGQLNDKAGQGAAYSNMASAYIAMGQHTRAIENLEISLDIAQQLGDMPGQGAAYGGLGIAYIETGQYAKAIENLEKDLDIAQQLNDTPGQGRAYGNMGNACIAMGQYARAIEKIEKHLDIAQQLGDTPGQGKAYGNMGAAYIAMGQYARAIENLEKDLDIVQQLGDTPGQGKAYGNMAAAYIEMGQYTKAIENLEVYLDIAQRLDDAPGQGKAFGNLGNAFMEMGQYARAIDNLEKCLGIAQQLDDKPGQERAHGNLGGACRELGQHARAIENMEKCLDIAQQLDDTPGRGRAYGNLGGVYVELGQYARAIDNLEKCLDIAQQLDDTLEQGRVYGNLALAYSGLGEPEKGIEYGHKLLQIAQELDDMPAQRTAHGNLGVAFARSGQLDLACRHFASSDALARQLEAQLTRGQWRRHLLSFGEAHTRFMDTWVVSAARSGDMVEALRVEEQRRCRSELAYQADTVWGRREGGVKDGDVSVDELKAMATSADAAFVVVVKMFDSALLTWVLSGETGELVYERCLDKAHQDQDIAEWVASVTFAKWEGWHQTFSKARDELVRLRKASGLDEESSVADLIQSTFPDAMKGDMDEELWASIRDPSTFRSTICGFGPVFSALQRHIFLKAERAMGKLSTLLLEPIVDKCPALEKIVRGDCPSTKPVGAWLSSNSCACFSFSLSCARVCIYPRVIYHTLAHKSAVCACSPWLYMAADILFARPQLVFHPVLRAQGWQPLSDRKDFCGAGLVAAHSRLCANQMGRHPHRATIVVRGWTGVQFCKDVYLYNMCTCGWSQLVRKASFGFTGADGNV